MMLITRLKKVTLAARCVCESTRAIAEGHLLIIVQVSQEKWHD